MAKRSSRASIEQLNCMLDFFESHKGLSEGKFHALHGRVEAAKKWQELGELLNELPGAEKNASQWQVVWRDLKSRTSIKARERRKEMAQTGNKPLKKTLLTEQEMRILGHIGAEYVEGSQNCADSIPEEEELQLALESGDLDPLLLSPKVPNLMKGDEATQAKVPKFSTASDPTTSHAYAKPHLRKEKSQTQKAEQFAMIAMQQADALTMQAEAAQKQAEASKQHAEALLIQARALEKFVGVFEDFANSVKLIAERK